METHKKLTAVGRPVVVPIEEEKEPVDADRPVWNSCCLRMDSRATVYFSQLIMAFGVLGFCFYQLVKAEFDCNRGGPYWGAISMILGVILGRNSAVRENK